MSGVTLRIGTFDAGQDGFPVTLAEEGGAITSGVMPRPLLLAGSWRGPAVPHVTVEAAVDDLLAMLNDDPAGRNDADWGAACAALCELLVPAGPVRTRFRDLPPASTPVVLDIAEEALARVPWEIAARTRPALRPAVMNGMSRLAPASTVRTRAAADWPFRILLVIGCAEAEEATLGARAEREAIERRFLPLGRSVDVHVLLRPSKPGLVAHVRQYAPHALHFIGHASAAGNGIALKIADPDGAWDWSVDEIDGDLLTWDWTPRFVFLNACRSAAEHVGSWSLQRAFLEAGAGAVLAMQADVRGDHAGALAAQLYERCAAGDTLQEALRDWRVAAAADPATATIDWGVPSLAATAAETRLLTPRPRPSGAEWEACGEFDETRYFADCRDLRRAFTYWLSPVRPPAGAPANALVLKGVPRSGKSHLVKWCMESWALAGARVRYIEVHDGTAKNFLSVLRQIRDGEADQDIATHYLHEGLPAVHFRRFNWELNNLLTTGQRGDWDQARHGQADVVDQGRPLDAKGETRLEPGVCAAFGDALRRAAERPLVLVFDRLGGPRGERMLAPDEFAALIQHLFTPLAEDPKGSIRLVFNASEDEFGDYRLRHLPQANTVVHELHEDVTEDLLVQYAVEMMWFRSEEQVRPLAQNLLQLLRTADLKGLARLSLVTATIKQAFDQHLRRMR